MSSCNPCHIPMDPRKKLSKNDDEPFVDATEYRRIIESLRYLVNTRPDLTYSVGIVSRYMETPTVSHMNAVKQILRYVKGTVGMGIEYKKNQNSVELVGYSDSDLAGDTEDRKSTTGILFFLGESPITWVSQKQRVVALSSCEAEYIAATGAKNPVYHERSKHINIRFHFIRECVQNGSVQLEYTKTEVQLADVLTKPLARQRFFELRDKIGVKQV
ncbi:secreted RxLR effector protein 161 [Manihot esculenta]|uniref:secreted RxLR effector protein 161 n=1 Tax=Manihot esculenta TaxID=3983 RepID=UPI001CC43C73|nr:secreted RxLR effector protein 161 [Manihot esculenta]